MIRQKSSVIERRCSVLAGMIIDYWAGTNPVLQFNVKEKDRGESLLELEIKRLVHCGRTARDQLRLPQHAAIAPSPTGERQPVHGAVAFLVPSANITHSAKVQAYDVKNNAEVEPVVFFDEQEIMYVTSGSDHADRNLESIAGPKSKLWMPKVVAREAWLYEDTRDHWDYLVLRMWGYVEGVRKPYMDDRLSEILPPEALLKVVTEQCNLPDLKNTVIFGGSVPYLTEGPLWGHAWDFEILDPVLNRKIGHHYDVELVWR
jgi:hypothetical protein